jgi:hypothetical protein
MENLIKVEVAILQCLILNVRSHVRKKTIAVIMIVEVAIKEAIIKILIRVILVIMVVLILVTMNKKVDLILKMKKKLLMTC